MSSWQMGVSVAVSKIDISFTDEEIRQMLIGMGLNPDSADPFSGELIIGEPEDRCTCDIKVLMTSGCQCGGK